MVEAAPNISKTKRAVALRGRCAYSFILLTGIPLREIRGEVGKTGRLFFFRETVKCAKLNWSDIFRFRRAAFEHPESKTLDAGKAQAFLKRAAERDILGVASFRDTQRTAYGSQVEYSLRCFSIFIFRYLFEKFRGLQEITSRHTHERDVHTDITGMLVAFFLRAAESQGIGFFENEAVFVSAVEKGDSVENA